MYKTFRFFLLTTAVVAFCANISLAQNIQLKRWVFGNGGTVASPAGNMSLSGITGQGAIESRSGGTPPTTIYQGFWVPFDTTVGVEDDPISFSKGISNYPNPFNNQTTIRFDLQGTSYVTLKIFDMVGQEMITLFNGLQEQGSIEIPWNGTDKYGVNVGSGSYVYELQVRTAQISGGDSKTYSLRNVMVIIR